MYTDDIMYTHVQKSFSVTHWISSDIFTTQENDRGETVESSAVSHPLVLEVFVSQPKVLVKGKDWLSYGLSYSSNSPFPIPFKWEGFIKMGGEDTRTSIGRMITPRLFFICRFWFLLLFSFSQKHAIIHTENTARGKATCFLLSQIRSPTKSPFLVLSAFWFSKLSRFKSKGIIGRRREEIFRKISCSTLLNRDAVASLSSVSLTSYQRYHLVERSVSLQ